MGRDIKLSPPRAALLRRLVAAGGAQKGKFLTVPARRLASLMQGDGLVRWEAGAGRTGGNLDAWTLHITEAGFAAIAKEPKP